MTTAKRVANMVELCQLQHQKIDAMLRWLREDPTALGLVMATTAEARFNDEIAIVKRRQDRELHDPADHHPFGISYGTIDVGYGHEYPERKK